MKDIFGILAVMLVLVAYIPYIKKLLQRKIQPHPYSWLVWGITSSLVFTLQALNGSGAAAWSQLASALLYFVICILAYRNSGTRHMTRSDTFVLITALFALALWLLIDAPVISMLVLTLVEVAGILPTIRKTWSHPRSEATVTWATEGLRSGITVFAISTPSLLTLVNPVAWCIGNLSIVAIILFQRYSTKNSTNTPAAAPSSPRQ